jgi:HIRAN domain
MGFLRRILSPQPAWPPAGPITSWPPEPLKLTAEVKVITFDAPSRPIDVVGEGSYQGTLEAAGGGRTIDGPKIRDHVAVLLPEPSNAYDRSAVRVVLASSGVIGYLSREDALAYRPLIDRLAAVGKIVACQASLSGGWDRGPDDRGHIGVRLFLDTPERATRELEADPANLRPTWGGDPP